MVLRQLLKRVNCFTLVILILAASFLVVSNHLYNSRLSSRLNLPGVQHDDGHEYLEPVPCQGPRGISLPDSPQDSLNPSLLDGGEYAITDLRNVTDGRHSLPETT